LAAGNWCLKRENKTDFWWEMKLTNNDSSQILAITCFDPIGNQGGVSKVVREHEKMFLASGYSYCALFPIAKIRAEYWGYTVDGEFRSLLRTNELIRQIAKNRALTGNPKKASISNKVALKEIHIHHFMRIQIERLETLLAACDAPVKFFVHDFYAMCATVNFIDANGNYCGDAAASNEKCDDCAYYPNTRKHAEKVRRLFQSIGERLTVIAPSEYALSVWQNSFGDLGCKVKVVPHQFPEGIYADNNKVKSFGEPLNIAYVGGSYPHKGYSQWLTAIKRCIEKKKKYQLFILGKTKDKIKRVTAVNVDVSKNPNDMICKLREYKIDVAVLNSIWGETYSYTYFESLAANAFIVTNKNSGNIANCVKAQRNGLVMENPNDLADLLDEEYFLRSAVAEFKVKSEAPLDLKPNNEITKICKTHKEVNFIPIAELTSNGIFDNFTTILLGFGYRIARAIKALT
jgi:glycosyltransferase involved in cell wall biosynthesis